MFAAIVGKELVHFVFSIWCIIDTHQSLSAVSSRQEFNYTQLLTQIRSASICQLFRSARTSCTTSGEPARPYALKIWTPVYRQICLMNNQETHETNPMAPWDPQDAPLEPLVPPGPPNRPPGTPKQVSWPH